MNGTVIIIDGNSLMNRAYYAIRNPMMTDTGLYTHGVFAFLNMLNKLVKDYQPDFLAVAFDRKAPTFRHQQYKDYKAGRKKMPPELLMQFPLLKEVLAAKNILMLEIDGYEADDILGTVSLAADKQDLRTYLVTGDRDAFQLASENTTIIYTRRGVSVFDSYDEKGVFDEYGFSPAQFIDYKALMGDSSDNLPGIPGIGDKTARKLIQEYGSLEQVISSVDSMKKGKMRDNIEEFAMQAMMSKRLATIFRQVPVAYTFEEMRVTEPDYPKLEEIYRKLEFRSFLKKMAEDGHLSQKEDSAEELEKLPVQPEESKVEIDRLTTVNEDAAIIHVTDEPGLEKAFDDLHGQESIWMRVFHNNSHTSVPAISSVCLAAGDRLYLLHWEKWCVPACRNFFRRDGVRICGHDLKADMYALISNQAVSPAGNPYVFNICFDTALAQYLIEPSMRSYELSELAPLYLDESFPNDKEIHQDLASIDLFGDFYEKEAEYGRRILSTASRLAPILAEKLSEEQMLYVFRDIELPLSEVLADMESSGIKTDGEVLKVIGDSLTGRIEELTRLIHAMAGEEFNINSPKQLGQILFEKLELKNGKKTKTGYSTSAEVLEKLKDQHPIIPLILEYRMLTKLTGTYVEGMLPLIDATGRIHAHFQQTVAATGRLSCTEPNLQNIPVRTELGRQFRKAFVSGGKDRILAGADYSQVELRIMAHLSDDEAMISSFEQEKDIHTITASRVFGVPEDEVTPIQRSRAKAVNFGVIYGISSFGLSRDIDITVKEAQQYIDAYFEKHPGVRRYMDECVAFCRAHGYVKTIAGRRRNIREIHAKNYVSKQLGERLAMNSPVQGSAADIIKLAMIHTYHALNEQCPDCKLVLQVHDELIIDAPKSEEKKVKKLLEECMSHAVSLKVPLKSSVNTGSNWYELK